MLKRYALLPALGLAVLLGCADGNERSLMGPEAKPVAVASESSGSLQLDGPTVTTDKDDYAPGETVVISGSGWWPGETVEMVLYEEPEVHEPRTLSSVADENGEFVNTDFSPEEHDIGVLFTLVATGLSSGLTAQTEFTDGTIQNATIQMRDGSTCTSAEGTVALGSSICAHAAFDIVGSGETKAQFRWKSPANAIVRIEQRSPDFPSATTSGTFSDTYTPTALGTWTVLLCQSDNTNPSPGGQPQCASGSEKASQTFTVIAASLDEDPPLVLQIEADPNPVAITGTVLITATISDDGQGDSDVTVAEYRILKTSLPAFDGGWQDFDAFTPDVEVEVEATVDLSLLNLPEAGLYELCVRGADEHGNESDGTDCITLVIYDPSAGFVTGGGWIDSPAGAYAEDPVLAGKAIFAFVSKYKKGASKPDGSTEFQFRAASFNFHSGDYDWLIVNQAGTNAQYKGKGTINGQGSFWFMLWAGDGSPDTFRIRIWEEVGGVEVDVYDNGSSQAIEQGSIVIHTGGNGGGKNK